MQISDITIEKLKTGKLRKELPEFYELKKVIENNPWHNNESTFVHTLAVLNDLKKFSRNNKNAKLKKYLESKIDNYKRKELLFLATVFHDLGKKETITKNGKVSSFPEHEKISIEKAKNILERFDLSKKESKLVLEIIKYHSFVHSIVEVENTKLNKQFDKLKVKVRDCFPELIIMVMTDTTCGFLKTTNPTKYKFRVNFYRSELKNL